jgi:hypothetical protein
MTAERMIDIFDALNVQDGSLVVFNRKRHNPYIYWPKHCVSKALDFLVKYSIYTAVCHNIIGRKW